MNLYEVTYWTGNFETLHHSVVLVDSPDNRKEIIKQIKDENKTIYCNDVDVTYIQSIELFEEEEDEDE